MIFIPFYLVFLGACSFVVSRPWEAVCSFCQMCILRVFSFSKRIPMLLTGPGSFLYLSGCHILWIRCVLHSCSVSSRLHYRGVTYSSFRVYFLNASVSAAPDISPTTHASSGRSTTHFYASWSSRFTSGLFSSASLGSTFDCLWWGSSPSIMLECSYR